jgi:hypothetical protein
MKLEIDRAPATHPDRGAEACHAPEVLDALISLARYNAQEANKEAGLLAACVRKLRKLAWSQRVAGEPKTWDRFCLERLGHPAAFLDALDCGVRCLEAEGLVHPLVAGRLDSARELPTDPRARPDKEAASRLVALPPEPDRAAALIAERFGRDFLTALARAAARSPGARGA